MYICVSASLIDREKYVVTITSLILQEKNIGINSSFSDFHFDSNRNAIRNCCLFIGIVSKNGGCTKRVLEDYKFAKTHHTPAILLVEDNIIISKKLKQDTSVIMFNRNIPNISINEIKEVKPKDFFETIAWMIGKDVVIKIISLLSTKL